MIYLFDILLYDILLPTPSSLIEEQFIQYNLHLNYSQKFPIDAFRKSKFNFGEVQAC